MKKITVIRPFAYYIDGYQRRDFAIGEHEAPYDCAAYAEKHGFARTDTKKSAPEKGDEKKDDGTDKPSGSKKTPAS
jgi:hypothetical protein